MYGVTSGYNGLVWKHLWLVGEWAIVWVRVGVGVLSRPVHQSRPMGVL